MDPSPAPKPATPAGALASWTFVLVANLAVPAALGLFATDGDEGGW
jgi:hypothetical protein